MGRNEDEFSEETEDVKGELGPGRLDGLRQVPGAGSARDQRRRAVRKAIELHLERRRLRRGLGFFI